MNKLPDDPQERLRVLQESFYMTLGNFFSGGTYNNIFLGLFSEMNGNIKKSNDAFGALNDKLAQANANLEQLNANIKKADESSGKLTSAIKNITLWGTIIALGSMLIAALSVALDYWGYFHQVA